MLVYKPFIYSNNNLFLEFLVIHAIDSFMLYWQNFGT